MESQAAINMVLSAGLTVLGWLARELWTAVKELKTDLAKLREDLPKNYVGQEHYREDIRELKGMTDKIYDRLNAKVEKWNFEQENQRQN